MGGGPLSCYFPSRMRALPRPRIPGRPPFRALAAALSAALSAALPAAFPSTAFAASVSGAGPAPVPPPQALEAIRDLRVHLDFDRDTATFASWPVDKFMRPLPADQIARAARLGLSLWAGILPDMRFRFVSDPREANLVLRFGPYRDSQGMDGWARAFLPDQWGRADPECGRREEGRRPDGSFCSEWSHNVITFHHRRWAVAGGDFSTGLDFHEYISWVFDRSRPHFVPRGGGPCRDGRSPDAVWSDACVPFPESPHHLEIAGVDLPGVIQHEVGHTLLGDHTPDPPGPSYIDPGRERIVDPAGCVRLGPSGYSCLFRGAEDKWWNRRCAFRADAERLRGMGYRVQYPTVPWIITLKRRDGATLAVSDWARAESLMLWSRQARPLTRSEAGRQYFLVDLRPDGARQRPPRGR